jgi:hypothetical protein
MAAPIGTPSASTAAAMIILVAWPRTSSSGRLDHGAPPLQIRIVRAQRVLHAPPPLHHIHRAKCEHRMRRRRGAGSQVSGRPGEPGYAKSTRLRASRQQQISKALPLQGGLAGLYLLSLAPGPPSSAPMKTTPAFSSAR